MNMSLKARLTAALPKRLSDVIAKKQLEHAIEQHTKRVLKQYKTLTTEQVFTHIYESAHWGKSSDPGHPYCSGSGSHNEEIVSPYVAAAREFLSQFKDKPSVVDLGCGDFSVGSKLRPLCGHYIACDIVPGLIAFNKEKYKAMDVDFRVLDLATDELPKAKIVFVRQVLQHLSNEHIKNLVPKLEANFEFLVLTEHLPLRKIFIPNRDKPAGPDTRLRVGSGVVLTKRPFKLKVTDERQLCAVPQYGGIIKTTLYALRQR